MDFDSVFPSCVLTKLLKDLLFLALTNQETDKASESQEHCLLPGEKIGGLWGVDVPADGSDLSEAEPQSSDSSRENTEPVRYVFYS